MKNLSIYDTRANELMAVIGEENELPVVLEGDKDIIPKFGLEKFQNLEDMMRYINDRITLLHAVPDEKVTKAEGDEEPEEEAPQEEEQPEEGEEQAPPNQGEVPEQIVPEMPTESLDARIKPAIDILKRLLQAAEKKHKVEAENKTQVQQSELEAQHAEVVQEQPYTMYVSVDGDNIGNAVFQAEQTDDEDKIREISKRINQGQEMIRQWTLQHSGEVIESGGDEGLLKVSSTAMDDIEEMRKDYKKIVKATLTVGIGKKISEATAARQLGKLRGKNVVVVFDEGTQQELQLRMENKDIDCEEKLKAITQSGGGVPGSMPQPKVDQAQEQEPQPKFAGGEDEAAGKEYGDWKEDGMPENDKPEEKPPSLNGSPKHREKQKKERRMAREYAQHSGDDPDFLQNVLSSVRGK